MLYVNLFGKFDIRYSDRELRGCGSQKSQELFAYLLLNRDCLHAREKLANLLWGGHYTTALSRKYLRDALWQLRSTLDNQTDLAESQLLVVESDWIQLNSIPRLQIDVDIFEAAYALVEGKPGCGLRKHEARRLDRALGLYQNNLLESWYHDWCLCERERLLQIYLMMLDKMMAYCEAHRQFEKGLAYGQNILQHDRARECTHRRMMRLYFMMGDRSTALRQYEQCIEALREELDLEPSERTTALNDQLRADRWETPSALPRNETGMKDLLQSLESLQLGLQEVGQHVQRTAEKVRSIMHNR